MSEIDVLHLYLQCKDNKKVTKLVRTSVTHPLRIDDLSLGQGRIGITLCPGKKGVSAFGARWDRDLDLDVAAIRRWGAEAVLSLIEDQEFKFLDVSNLGAAVKSQDMVWFHVPIQDLGVPSDQFLEDWAKISAELHEILSRGGRVLIHCRGGLGRAGTVAALMLIERGWEPNAAINTVRSVRHRAIETPEQVRWLVGRAESLAQSGVQLRASLLAGAYGDSLGAEIEFLSLDGIRRQFPNGISDLPPHQGLRGAVTDDTQMTLFTAEGIIRAQIRGALKGICHPPSVVHHALLRWYKTQGGTSAQRTDDVGLIEDRRLWARRAPGLTCISALRDARELGAPAKNNSKGCGTIMRVAPVALMLPRDQVRSVAIETSALTHGHPTGQLAAAAWAEILADVAMGADVEETATLIAQQYDQLEFGAETASAIRRALGAPRDGAPETVETLGGGWIAEEALSIALYACLAGTSFDHALQIAVFHSGDSDSTGSIAGNLLGLIHPTLALQHRWASTIEVDDLIAKLARDAAQLKYDPFSAEVLSRDYPGS